MNSFDLTGRLGQDPELKDVNGNKVAEFSVAEDHGYGTNWFNVSIWGKAAETVAENFEKGDGIEIENGTVEMSKGDDGTTYYNVRAYSFGFPVGSPPEDADTGGTPEHADEYEDEAPF